MKKLILFTGLAAMLASCEPKPSEQRTQTTTATTDSVNKTLNGYDEATAVKMMAHFLKNRGTDTNPVTSTFWIDKTMLHEIVKLLNAEEKQQWSTKPAGSKDSLGVTDGIRIYFASDTAITTAPLKNTIILVSTKNNGKAPANIKNTRGNLHKDYYKHAADARLFTLRNYEIQTIRSDASRGDSLYTTTPSSSRRPVCGLPNGIARRTAEDMVKYFAYGSHVINTEGVWFDLKFLNALAASKRLNGIRIYYARHPKSTDLSLSERDSFVITTTERDPKTGVVKDYFSCKEKSIEDYKATHNKQIGDPYDNGELCPDNCN